MTIGMALFIIFIILLVFFAINLMVETLYTITHRGEVCYIEVESLSTRHKYHASRYRYNKHNDMELLIYNGHNGYQWYPIWHFKNAFLISFSLDKSYAMNNMYKLCSFGTKEIELNKKVDKSSKNII